MKILKRGDDGNYDPGISALSCIKSHTNLSCNNVYNAFYRVPGFLLLYPRMHRGKWSAVRTDPGDSCVWYVFIHIAQRKFVPVAMFTHL